ncbi:MAG: RHS repeat-associated core domain-containing protein [Oscillospiraceae bacterium]|nr:RHS repeat-associated core domain-containing protein [Oscillospiraceae bacterium]
MCYDKEYGLYYLRSRFYNPEVGRFLNADAFAATGQGMLGNNMFFYCHNNPIMFIDPDGYCSEVGALLTWIDCGDPNCPTSSLNDPGRYRNGYNNPKHIDSQRY